MANTTNLNLVKPAGTDYALVSVINGNMDIIDSKVGAIPANESAQSQITALNNQIASYGFKTVNGTTGSNAHVNNQYCAGFPTGYNETNCIVVGSMLQYSDDKWYSNYQGNDVSTNDTGIWCKTASSGFSNRPIKIVLMKLP